MGQRTKFMELPTRFLMNAMSSERRWKRVALLSIAFIVAAGMVGAAALYALGANELAALHRDWAALQGCLIGAPLAQGEAPGDRVRLLQLSTVGVDTAKRPQDDGKTWPSSCASAAGAIAQHAPSAESGNKELAAAANALAKVLLQGGAAADLRKPVEDMFKAAQVSALKDVPAAKNATTPTPAQLAFPSLAKLPKLLGADALALGVIRAEPNGSSAVRFFVDEKGIASGPVVCTGTEGSDALACARVPSTAATQSPGLRLLGSSDASAQPFLFAGDRGSGGIFRGDAKASLMGATAYGAHVNDAGRGRLLVRRSGEQDFALLDQTGPGASLTDLFGVSKALVDNLNDASIAYDFLVYRAGAQTPNPKHLVARSLVDTSIIADAGEIADDPLPASDREPRFSACRNGGTTAVRVRGGKSDFVSIVAGGRWGAPAAVPPYTRGGALACREGEAWITQVNHGEGTGRDHPTIDVTKCTSGACAAAAHVSVFDMVHGSSEALPQDKASIAAAAVEGKILVVWNAGTTGGLRARIATPEKLSDGTDVLIADDVEPGTTQSAIVELKVFSAPRLAVVLVRTASGIVALRADGEGRLTAMSSVFK